MATWSVSATGFSDTQLRTLRAAALAATSSLAGGRTFELDLALAGVKQMDPFMCGQPSCNFHVAFRGVAANVATGIALPGKELVATLKEMEWRPFSHPVFIMDDGKPLDLHKMCPVTVRLPAQWIPSTRSGTTMKNTGATSVRISRAYGNGPVELTSCMDGRSI